MSQLPSAAAYIAQKTLHDMSGSVASQLRFATK